MLSLFEPGMLAYGNILVSYYGHCMIDCLTDCYCSHVKQPSLKEAEGKWKTRIDEI